MDSAAQFEISEEDELRARWYSLLGRLLAAPPDERLLGLLAGMEGDRSDFGQSVEALARTAAATTPEAVEEEYFNLFIGIGQGELLPYGSYYLTGFLHEKPLARLRDDLRALGVARAQGVSEPEDHIAALCETMAGLITGSFGQPADLATQDRFFREHIACWAPRFFEDLQAAEGARFYMPLGGIGRQFMTIESQAFEMAA